MKRFHLINAAIVAALALVATLIVGWATHDGKTRCSKQMQHRVGSHRMLVAQVLTQAAITTGKDAFGLPQALRSVPRTKPTPLVYAARTKADSTVENLWTRSDAATFVGGTLPSDPNEALAALTGTKGGDSRLQRYSIALPDKGHLRIGFGPTAPVPAPWWPTILVALLGLAASIGAGFVQTQPKQAKATLQRLVTELHPDSPSAPKDLDDLAQTVAKHCRSVDKTFEQARAYFAKPIFDRLKTGQPIGGEERAVAVMRVDLSGIADRLGTDTPDQVLGLANTYLDVIVEALTHQHAVIGSISLHGVDAWWGSPDDLPEPELHAAKAAVEIRRAVFELERRQKTIGHPVAHVRIGIASGRCLLARLGSTRQMAPALVGHAVAQAQRLASLAGPEEILVTQSTAVLAEGAGLRLEALSSPDTDGTLWRLLSDAG